MERSPNKIPAGNQYIIAGLCLLGIGMLFGCLGGLQYVLPGFLRERLSFEKTRPLHVSSVIFWIIMAASGAVITYLQEHIGKKDLSATLLNIQRWLFLFAIVAILLSYCIGKFGGREYWEYPPVLSLPIVLAWIIFLCNVLSNVGSIKHQPVYLWMWLTGIIFFLFTFSESYLWLFPYFRNNIINDMTIQWKSYGSMVGSWNMLIYGCSIFLMDKITGNKKSSHSPAAFALYFTGLFNLMFNWGHHIYTLPTHAYIKHISYAVSMTELFIFARIIYKWKATLVPERKFLHLQQYRFLMAAEYWIFLNLALALLMSVPAVNVYTHGTHITVAHAMGTTIGINTMLLLAVAFDILVGENNNTGRYKKILHWGFWISNISLFIFWIVLIVAGITKASWQMSNTPVQFSDMMQQLRPFFVVFVLAGIALMTGILLVIYPLLKHGLLKRATGKTHHQIV